MENLPTFQTCFSFEVFKTDASILLSSSASFINESESLISIERKGIN